MPREKPFLISHKFTQQQINKSSQPSPVTQPMIRQSQISSFLDLLTHIAEIKDQTRLRKKKNSKQRYEEQEETQQQKNQQSPENLDSIARTSMNPYQQRRMMKGFMEKKRTHQSFKLDHIPSQQASDAQIPLSNPNIINKEKKSFFELYCQEIHKKREEKISRIIQGKMGKNKMGNGIQEKVSKENNSKSKWEEDIIASLEKHKQIQSLHRERSMPPIAKSKNGKQSEKKGKERRDSNRKVVHRFSTKKVQPFQLNIGTIGQFRMPKICNKSNSLHIAEFKQTSSFKIQYENADPSKKRKAKIGKMQGLSGWAQEDDNNKFFNHDLF